MSTNRANIRGALLSVLVSIAVSAPAEGQFGDGIERQPPGSGSLAMALVVDSVGRIDLVPPGDLPALRARGGIQAAFQSYPMLLSRDGTVPENLQLPGRGVDLEHRDSRLAIGKLRDGRILIALTRFEGLGGILEALPIGPTTPEMAGLMGALGCESAMLLDGGLSGQLMLKDGTGQVTTWTGLRRVPLGLVFTPR